MDQRKRTARLAKNSTNDNSMGPPPPQVSEDNEVFEVTALAISPTPEEVETRNNAPAAECRRSSRKKIIKFDVRDLLNKNRKTHKIQIEARIDSNAPTTSKASTSMGGDVGSATSLSTSGDLLSKQKTFLEKSAIFRRYSISQEPKPPPLPLPPSLLAKGGDNKDSINSGGSTSRRLSRTQDYFSNVMIKPKQTTSLIVAQMESSAPSSMAAGKRKSLNRSLDVEPKIPETTESAFSNATIQKKRGRPSKIKTQTSEDNSLATASKEDTNVKKLTPEKAKNWKEYKACLAQQSEAKTDSIPLENIKKPSVKSSESLTADVVLEISSSSSTHSSNIEDLKDSAKEFLTGKQQQVKRKEDSPTKFNLLAEIVIEDSNSKEAILIPTKTEDILKETEDNEIIIEKVTSKDLQTTKEPIIEVVETTETIEISKKDNKFQLNETLEQGSPLNEENKIENKEQPETDETKPKNCLEKEKDPDCSQSTKKEATEKRTKAKLNESSQKEKNLKGKKSPTNLEDVPEQFSSKGKTSPTNLDDTIQKDKDSKASNSSKEQPIEKMGLTKQNKPLEKETESKISLFTKEKVIDNNSQTKLEDTIKNKIDAEGKKSPITLNDSLKNEKEYIVRSSKEIISEEGDQSKKVEETEHAAEKRDQPIPDDSLPEEKLEQRAGKKIQLKVNDISEKDIKESKSIKVVSIGRRSRSKRDDSPQEETGSKGSPSNKEQKSIKKSQTEQKFFEASESNDEPTTVKTSQLNIDDKSLDDETDSETLQSLTHSTKKDSKKSLQTKVEETVQKNLDSEVSQCTKEETKGMISRSKLKDSMQEEIDSKTSSSTKEDTVTTPSNKRKSNKKDITEQKDDNTKDSADKEADDNKNLLKKSDQTTCKENTEETQTKAFEQLTDTNSSNKQTTRSKRNINKLEETIQKTEDIDSPTNKNEVKDKISETKDLAITEEVPDTKISSHRKEELKSPESITNITQIQENTPSTSIEEFCLSQPSTPSGEKSITISRTSSSSESENMSERSSYSSATSSTSRSSRSYKSGDKLKVSVKRVSLPQSPSASSQTSASEEQNSPQSFPANEENKKKIPTAKRSKRLQKKFVEMMMKQQDSIENIDDCFEKIPTDDKKELQIKNNDTIDKENLTEKIQEAASEELAIEIHEFGEEVSNLEEKFSSESVEKKEDTKTSLIDSVKTINKEGGIKDPSVLDKEQLKDVFELANEDELMKPSTSKSKNGNSNLVKRKSLRNRKELDSENKEQEAKESIKEAETPQEKQTEKIQESENLNESDKTEIEEQQEKETETKLQQKRKLKEQSETLPETKQQQRRKPKEQKDKNQEQQGVNEEKQEIEKRELEENENVNESDKMEIEKKQEIQTETKLQQKRKLKEQSEILPETKQQQKRKAKEQQEKNQEKKAVNEEKQELEGQLELQTGQKQQQERSLKKQPIAQEKQTEQNQEVQFQEKDNNETEKVADVEDKLLVVTTDIVEVKPTKEIKGKKTSKSPKAKSKEVQMADNEYKQLFSTELAEVEIKPTKEIKGKMTSKSPKAKSKEVQMADNEDKQLFSTELAEVEITPTKEIKGKMTSKSPKAKSKDVEMADNEDKQLDVCTDFAEVEIKPTKEIKGKKSSKSPTAKSKEIEQDTQIKTNEFKDIESTKLNVSSSEIKDKEYTQPSPTRSKSGKDKTSAAKLIDKETTNESSKPDIKGNEPSTRSRTGKDRTSIVKASESPKPSTKSSGETDKPDDNADKNKSSKSLSNKYKEETSSVEPESITKFLSDITEKESSKADSKECEKESSSINERIDIESTKLNVSSTEVKDKEYTQPSPTRSKSGKDKTSAAKLIDKETTKESSKPDIKENEPSTRSRTGKDKTSIVKAESPKPSAKSSGETDKPDDDDADKNKSSKSLSNKYKDETSSVEPESITTFLTDITEKESLKADSKKSEKELSSKKSTEVKESPSLSSEKTTKAITDVSQKEASKSKGDKEPVTTTEDTIINTTALTEQISPKPSCSTKTKTDKETPSSAKRKSLRNQKDKIPEDSNSSSISSMDINEPNEDTKEVAEEPIFTLNIQEHIEKEKLDISIKTTKEETIKVSKRRGRKSRFKNLHGPETESETESSTGKQTPIEETMLMERKDNQTPIPIESVKDKENKKEVLETQDNNTKSDGNNVKETSDDIQKNLKIIEPLTTVASKEKPRDKYDVIKSKTDEKSQTKEDDTAEEFEKTLMGQTDVQTTTAAVSKQHEKSLITAPPESYLIQNVSIETNTLLDILRTVQSNTAAAALVANKTPENYKNNENPTKDTTDKDDTQISVTKSEDLPTTTSQDKSLVTLKSLRKIESDSNTNSPTRSETASPLTLKKVAISPTRSDSSSPLTLKKVGLSPTRSDTLSPLTLKKVTRRYERRSRRGEEAEHKTLEETFAEIAAQSSKAVLAAKTFDSNEELTAGEKDEEAEKLPKEIEGETPTKIVNEDKLSTEVTEKPKKPSAEEPENVKNIEKTSLEVSEKVIVIEKISTDGLEKSEDKEKTSIDTSIEVSESKVLEKELETPEPCKVTPARRGRKPKNRPIEVLSPATKDIEIKSAPKTKKDIEKTSVTPVKDKELEEQTSKKISSAEKPIQTNDDLNPKLETVINKDKSKTSKDSETLSTLDTTQQEISKQDSAKESSELTQTPETSTKSCKKAVKKRDTSKELPAPAEDDISLLEVSNKLKEDDIRTPKQAPKKRDSSLTKSETKTNNKKCTKKTKNNEEESLVTQKEDNTPKTTTPPPKRGRKPKNQQEPPQPTTSSKKKTKKEASNDNNGDDDDGIIGETKKDLESESESLNSSLDKSLDEKMAKKKRQKKLKEAFEAALTDDLNKSKDTTNISSSSTSSFGLTLLNKSPPPERRESLITESIRVSCITPIEPEEDPDPLKDIEKFIADGVNLLKKDYKLDEDSVDDVITTTTLSKSNEEETTPIKTSTEDDKPIFNIFETPADTPITTPSVTPPPKSPNSIESSTPDENCGVRRSHRIKKTPKALVGRGLVRDKERFSIKDDVETKSHYTLDDHLTDLAEVEAKNAKFLKEMEERLSNFQVIKENEYLCERVISREARKMICDCFLTHEEEERGELGCGEDCLNRLLMIECGPECTVKERCTNKRFQKLLCSPCRVFRTEKKGFGIMADIEILPGEFILEYVGEVIDTNIFEQRRVMYSLDKNRHYYFMALRSDAIIDATIKGNISRFINHSCDPNAETQKWTVNGELRIGFFSRKSIMPGEEITFNYQYQRYGREAQRCYCESSNCRGWIGPEPTSDEGEQIDDEDESEDDDDEEEEEELQDTSNLLVQDDDEDSDTSVTDPEEVQKKLEMAAAQAEVELAPISILEEPTIPEDSIQMDNKDTDDSVKPETPVEEEEDSKSKFKKLLSKMAEKVAAKQKQNKREQKLQRKKKSKESSSDLSSKLRFLEDPDIEDEVEFLRECGLKNQSDTLRLSRLMVRAKLVQTRLNLLDILRQGDLPCRRLFLDYHGLRLVHGWMSEDAGNMQIRLALLQTLDTLPIANKTVLTDSKVMQVVRNWCGSNTALSPNEDSSSSNSNSHDVSLHTSSHLDESSDLQELQKLALKLITTWEGLAEIFRIPKKERIEQMKEHEREADRQYAANAETEENKSLTDRYRRDRFGKGFNSSTNTTATTSNRFTKPNNGNPLRLACTTTPENIKNLSKTERREMFAAKVARDEAEKRMAEERREFETKCRFFGLDPKKTRPQDVPFCVNPATGQWFSIERKPIATPPSYAHVQVPVKPKSTDPNDYQLPAVCSTLPAHWKFAITPQGKIYYYHIKYRIPQWEPPTSTQLQLCEIEAEEGDSESELTTTAGEDSSEDDDEILIGMDTVQLRAYMYRKVEARRQKRYQRLVDQRAISPRREEDRIYNQIEVRKYKENKEKIRKRKEEIRRKRAEALRQSSLNMCTLGSITDTSILKIQTESGEELGVLPIQDYLLSSDEEIDLKAEIISPLIDKIVEGDKIVDELDALTSKRQLKRPLPPHRDFNEPSTSTAAIISSIERQEYKKRKLEKKEKRKPKDQDAKYRKNKEKFRCEIAGIIVHHLKPYRKDSCAIGRIKSNEDFNHLARKLTHFVMIKELKYCDSVGQILVVTESVKNKSREFIKKYMAKYSNGYVKPSNDPDFKDIPFTL